MNVLELASLYPPSIGGTEGYVARQAEELARRGHSVTVLTHGVGDAPFREVTPDGITIVRTQRPWLSRVPGLYENPARQFSPTVPDPKDLRLIRHLVEETKPDIVLAHNWIIYSYLAFKGPSHPPVLWILHDYGAICHKQNLLYRPLTSDEHSSCPGARIDRCIPCGRSQYGWAKSALLATGLQLSRRLLHPKVDGVIAVSGAVSEHCQPAFDRPIRIIPTFLADGLREVAFRQPRPVFCPEGDYLLFVGALDWHKGLDVLLEAHRDLRHEIPLVIIGTKSPRRSIPSGAGVTVAVDVDHDVVMERVGALHFWRGSLRVGGALGSGRCGSSDRRQGGRRQPGWGVKGRRDR